MIADQINAYGLVAEALTHRAYDKAGTFDPELPTTETIYCHDGMSTFENVADCLEVLNIFGRLSNRMRSVVDLSSPHLGSRPSSSLYCRTSTRRLRRRCSNGSRFLCTI